MACISRWYGDSLEDNGDIAKAQSGPSLCLHAPNYVTRGTLEMDACENQSEGCCQHVDSSAMIHTDHM